MSTKVTVQDIADALGLSRTTVSKVLNQSPAVSDATRTMVLNKAREMNYRPWNQPEAAAEAPASGEVSCFALVMHAIPGGYHMGTIIIPSLDQKLRQSGYSLMTCAISDSEYETMHLPPILETPQVKAIVTLEMFHPEYSRLLCSLGKPVLFIDACTDFFRLGLHGDLLLMENRYSVGQLLTTLIGRHGIGTMGFVGDANHCISFRERYEAFLLTAVQQAVETDPYCILSDDSCYSDIRWLQGRLEAMKQLPELFFCANDYLAQLLIHALENMGKRVPEDVMVCGFDGLPSISKPLNQMTTIVTPSDQLGAYAASILLRKLSHRENTCCTTYLKTTLLFRETAP